MQSATDPARRAAALTKAVMSAAGHLGINISLLARILRADEMTVARMQVRAEVLAPGSKSSVRGELLVQLFHHLDRAMSHNDEASRTWLNAHCLELGGRPITIIQSGEGLMKAVAYVSHKQQKAPPPGS